MDWNFSSDSPIYAQLVEKLQVGMVTGAFPPGSKLPSVREFATEAGVNPNTMQRAMGELERLGLVFSQRTAGRFVTEDAAAIAQVKDTLAQAIVTQFLEKAASLGYSRQEILALVTLHGEETNP